MKKAAVFGVAICLLCSFGSAQEDPPPPIFVGLDVIKVVFKTDHNVLRNWWVDFRRNGGALFNPRGWEWFGPPNQPEYIANPVSHTKGIECKIDVTHRVSPAGHVYYLEGYQNPPHNWLHFLLTGLVSTGESYVTVEMVKTTPMPNMVLILNYRMEWLSYGPVLGIFEDHKMAGHNIYITWDTPFGSVPTAKRVHWACEKANGSETIEHAADGIWHAIGEPVDPPMSLETKIMECQYHSKRERIGSY